MANLNESDLNLYFQLEEQIAKEANELLIWYDKNVQSVANVSDFSFDWIDNGNIFYDAYICQESTSFTLTQDLLFMSEEERNEYAKKFKAELAEIKRNADKEKKEKLIQDKIDFEIYEREELKRLKRKYEF